MSKKAEKQAEIQRKWEEAAENAIHVANNADLKTAIGKKALVIISSDQELYERLLQKFPKENVASGAKSLGKFLVGLGLGISILTGGFLSFVGIPMDGIGAAFGATGMVLDDYKDYILAMDYDKKQVIFFKVKGSPCLEMPKNASAQKLTK